MEWNRTYGGTGRDFAESIVQTIDGGYALVGDSASNAWFVKTDSAGNMKWNRTYGGTESSSAYSVTQTSDGGYAIAGATGSAGTGGWDDCYLVKTDALGYVQWSKTYGGEGMEVALSVIQTSDGGYALGGITRPGAGEGDFLLVKTNSTGNMEWSKTYGSQDKDEGHAVVQTSDGGYALAGLMWNRSGGGSAGIIKTEAVGNTQWKRNYDGGTAWSIALTSDGGYIVACSRLVKTDSEGKEQWAKTLNGSAYSVIQTHDGGYAVAGIVFWPVTIDGVGTINSDAWLIKTDAEGNYNPSLISPSLSPTPESFPTTMVQLLRSCQ